MVYEQVKCGPVAKIPVNMNMNVLQVYWLLCREGSSSDWDPWLGLKVADGHCQHSPSETCCGFQVFSNGRCFGRPVGSSETVRLTLFQLVINVISSANLYKQFSISRHRWETEKHDPSSVAAGPLFLCVDDTEEKQKEIIFCMESSVFF